MILPIVAALIVTIGVVVYLAIPLVRPTDAVRATGASPVAELLARRDRIIDELRDAEFDFRVGKLTPDDYAASRERLETEAARVLQAIDGQVAGLDEEVEQAVRELRAHHRSCPSCGAPVAPAARFCVGCGLSLQVTVK